MMNSMITGKRKTEFDILAQPLTILGSDDHRVEELKTKLLELVQNSQNMEEQIEQIHLTIDLTVDSSEVSTAVICDEPFFGRVRPRMYFRSYYFERSSMLN